jgi:predicted transcriptional regulator
MKLTDITVEWIAQHRDALGLKDIDVYTAAGMAQDHFSKSMNGKRQFKPAELQAILEYLTGEEAASNLPTVVEIRAHPLRHANFPSTGGARGTRGFYHR